MVASPETILSIQIPHTIFLLWLGLLIICCNSSIFKDFHDPPPSHYPSYHTFLNHSYLFLTQDMGANIILEHIMPGLDIKLFRSLLHFIHTNTP